MPASECYPDKAPTVDTLLDTLSQNLRREIIRSFENQINQSSATFDELVSYLDSRVPDATRGELTVVLHHTH